MTGVLIWKVYREQRLVWIAIAGLAVGILVLDRTLLEPGVRPYHLAGLFCMIAYVYGLVAGAMLLAGEREEGTATFLQTMPAEHLAIWRAKGAAGGMLVLSQVLVLWLVVLVNDSAYRDAGSAAVLFMALASVAVLGFAWGLFFSSWTRTALGAILAAALVQAVAAWPLLFLYLLMGKLLSVLLALPPEGSWPAELGAALGLGALLVGGLLVASGGRQAWIDRQRGRMALPARQRARMALPAWSEPAASGSWRSHLAALLGQGLAALVVLALLFLVISSLLESDTVPRMVAPLLGLGLLLIGLGVLVVVGLLDASEARQIQRDRVGSPESSPARYATRASGSWRSQVAALLWLVWRQSRWLYLGLAITALFAGLFLPLLVLTWPLLTLLLGVSSGVAVFAGEQGERTGCFLGEQRLAPTVVWACKVGTHLVLAVGVALLLLFPTGLRVALEAARSQSGQVAAPLDDLVVLAPYLEMGPYLTLGLGYGFSVGCLCGLLFSRLVTSSFIACGVSLQLTILWAPSLLVGGLHAWQIWGTPLLLLLTVRLLLWPWATGRLWTIRGMVYLTGGLIVAGLWLAGALAYRVVEVPLVEDHLDLAGFEQTVAVEWRNKASQLTRDALRQLPSMYVAIEPPQAGPPDGPPGLPPAAERNPGGFPGVPEPPTVGQAVAEVIQRGWPPEEPKLGAWLDKEFRQPWVSNLAEATRLPSGVVEEVRSMTLATRISVSPLARVAAELLVARGLQLQARGDPAAFVENLAIGLALVRQVSHREPPSIARFAGPAQQVLMSGVERWLERLGKRPDLLRRVLALLIEHDQAMAQGPNDSLRADYLMIVNTVSQPRQWVSRRLRLRSHLDSEKLASLVWLAWRTPWEQSRLQRLVRLAANQPGDPLPLPKLLVGYLPPAVSQSLQPQRTSVEASLRFHELIVALGLYQAETGQPTRTLEALTPKILASVPVDPTTGKPFGYRLSAGEELPPQEPGQVPRKVPPGQGILTSKEEAFVMPPPPGQ